MKFYLSILISMVFLGGCASTELDKNYAKYLDTQAAMANRPQQPLLRIKAQPGATVQMSGVDEFVVYAPEANQPTAAVQQYVTPRNDTTEVIKSAFGVVGTVGSIVAVGQATKGLANAVGSSANHGYQYVQSPQPNQTISGSGVIGSGTYNTTTSTSTLGGSGVIGSGSLLSGTGSTGAGNFTSTPTTTTSTTTTTTTDNHTVTTTNPVAPAP